MAGGGLSALRYWIETSSGCCTFAMARSKRVDGSIVGGRPQPPPENENETRTRPHLHNVRLCPSIRDTDISIRMPMILTLTMAEVRSCN